MLSNHLEKIRHFMGVSRYDSIRNYAVKENISQSAVSKSIKILEDILDTILFLRKRTGIELTQAGYELFKFGEKLSDLVEDTEKKLIQNQIQKIGGVFKYWKLSEYFNLFYA